MHDLRHKKHSLKLKEDKVFVCHQVSAKFLCQSSVLLHVFFRRKAKKISTFSNGDQRKCHSRKWASGFQIDKRKITSHFLTSRDTPTTTMYNLYKTPPLKCNWKEKNAWGIFMPYFTCIYLYCIRVIKIMKNVKAM